MSGPVPTRTRVLTVCTGNVCRSPLAERLLTSRLSSTLGCRAAGVVVESAGTHAMVGSSMTRQAAAQLCDLGGSSTGFVSRQLTASMVADADLVVTATRAHRAAVVTLCPQALLRTFTLRELGRLLDGVAPGVITETAGGTSVDLSARVQALLAVARSRRGQSPPARPEDDDVIDPYQQPDSVYAVTTGQIAGPVEVIVAALNG